MTRLSSGGRIRDKIRPGSAGLGVALVFCLLWGWPLKAQEGFAPEADGPASTITLTKVVPVYEFENLRVTVDQYQVNSGDTLDKILKARGLLGGRAADQDQLLRLVRELNPELKNLNYLTVGQTLKLPTTDIAPPAGQEVKSPGTTETVKIYERTQPNQKAARVLVMRHQVSTSISDGTDEADQSEAASAPSGLDPEAEADSAPPEVPVVAGREPLDFPSGNVGPLAREETSQVIYRTVRIRPGDTLERLLRREGLPRAAIYNHMLRITMNLNPRIKNPDLILAGTDLRIPAAGDYLTAAGLDPREVREAALAINQRRRPAPISITAGATESARRLPVEEVETAKSTLGLIFTRLGERVENQGRLMPAGAEEDLELDTRAYPVIYTHSGAKLILDLGSTLPRTTLAALRSRNFQVFRTRRGESLDRVLDNLWPLCGYYRIYTNERAYEGGGDIRLRISADWIVWPTEEAWNSGRPLVLNKVARGGQGTDPAWVRFLGEHGLTILDLERNIIRPPRETATEPVRPPPSITTLDSSNPRFLAEELLRLFGAEPRQAAPVEIKNGPEPKIVTAPLYWEAENYRTVLNFGELSTDEVESLRRDGLRVATADDLGSEAVIEAVLTGLGLKARENLVLTAPDGGPRMTLTIKGRMVTLSKRDFLLTPAAVPDSLARFLDPELKTIRY